MDYNRPNLNHHVTGPLIPPNMNNLLYYQGLVKSQAGGVGTKLHHHTVPGPGPGPGPGTQPPPSPGGRSFAAALRNLAKQAGPANDRNENDSDQRTSSPKTRGPPPSLVRGSSPQPIKPQEKDRSGSSNIGSSEPRSGFQPYRPPDEGRTPTSVNVTPSGAPPHPAFALDPAAAAAAAAYNPYHHPAATAGLYPPHLQHPYRLDEHLYLERCGMSLFPPYSPAIYGLMPTPLGLMTPAMHERLKLEEEHRQREQERERREKSRRSSPRASPSHGHEHPAKKPSTATPVSNVASTTVSSHLPLPPPSISSSSSSCSSSSLSHPSLHKPSPSAVAPPSISSTPVSQPQFVRPFEDNFQSSSTTKHSPHSPSLNLSKPTSFLPHPSPIATSASNELNLKLCPSTDSYKQHPLSAMESTFMNSHSQPITSSVDYYSNLMPLPLAQTQTAPSLIKNESRIPVLHSNMNSNSSSGASNNQPLVTNELLPNPCLASSVSESVPLFLNNHSPTSDKQDQLPSSSPSAVVYPYHQPLPSLPLNPLDPSPSSRLLANSRISPAESYNYHAPLFQPQKYHFPSNLATTISPTSTVNSNKHKPPNNIYSSLDQKQAQISSNCNSISKPPKSKSSNHSSNTLSKPNNVNKKVSCKVNFNSSNKVSNVSHNNNNNVKLNNNLAHNKLTVCQREPTAVTNSGPIAISAPKTKPLALDVSNLVPSPTNKPTSQSNHNFSVSSDLEVAKPFSNAFSSTPSCDYSAWSNGDPVVPSVIPTPPVLNVPDPAKLTSTTNQRPPSPEIKPLNNVISRLDQAERKRLNSEVCTLDYDSDDYTPHIFLTKGPPDKLDAPPRKRRFLAIFGLTTLAKRNELELNKLSRRRAVPTVKIDYSSSNQSPIEERPPHSLNLPHPSLSPQALPTTNEKLAYMEYLELQCVSKQERQEFETIWQEILAERRRRKAVTPLVLYCSEETQQISSSISEQKAFKWPGIEEILTAYHNYNQERGSETVILNEQVATLERINNQYHKEVERLELKLSNLQSTSAALKEEKQQIQQYFNKTCSLIKEITAISSCNQTN